MKRKHETRKIPDGAPRRTKDGEEQVRVRVDGRDQWFTVSGPGRFRITRPEWYAQLKMADGTRKLVKLLRDRVASEALLSDLRRQQERILTGIETPIKKSDEDFSRLIARYWVGRARSGRCTSVYLDRSGAILRLTLEELGVQSVEDFSRLNKTVIEKWIDKSLAKGFAAGSINQRVIQLKLFQKWLLAEGLIPRLLPFTRLSEKPKDIRRAVTREEVDKLREVAPWPRGLWYALLFCTLARKSALRAITSRDLFLSKTNPYMLLRAKNAKTKRDQEIPLPVWLLPEIEQLVDEEIPGKHLWHRMDAWNLNDALDSDLESAGIPKHTEEGKLVIHSFRHGGTTELLKNGVNILLVQRMGGWTSLDMLASHYAHLSPLRERESIDQVFSIQRPSGDDSQSKKQNAN